MFATFSWRPREYANNLFFKRIELEVRSVAPCPVEYRGLFNAIHQALAYQNARCLLTLIRTRDIDRCGGAVSVAYQCELDGVTEMIRMRKGGR